MLVLQQWCFRMEGMPPLFLEYHSLSQFTEVNFPALWDYFTMGCTIFVQLINTSICLVTLHRSYPKSVVDKVYIHVRPRRRSQKAGHQYHLYHPMQSTSCIRLLTIWHLYQYLGTRHRSSIMFFLRVLQTLWPRCTASRSPNRAGML